MADLHTGPRRSSRKRTAVNYSETRGGSSSSAPAAPKKSTTSIRKPRVVSGRLSGMMNVPVDIFLEIVSCLHPRDLLQLARSSKHIRSIILSRKNRSVWRASLQRFRGLPPVPDDMCEPSYAALLFDCLCFTCGVPRVAWHDYAIRLRLCKSCEMKYIKKGKDILATSKPVSDRHAEICMAMVPCETRNRLDDSRFLEDPGVRHMPFLRWYAPDLTAALSKRLRSQRKGETFEEYRANLASGCTARHKFATTLLTWERTLEEEVKKDVRSSSSG
ncbi:hypothetical protein C8Q77DRAFT_1127302 [Trametes polyzona]|nr:hypothetical protein C8Q77DRAFT_1127302 [Trametes polyzona]